MPNFYCGRVVYLSEAGLGQVHSEHEMRDWFQADSDKEAMAGVGLRIRLLQGRNPSYFGDVVLISVTEGTPRIQQDGEIWGRMRTVFHAKEGNPNGGVSARAVEELGVMEALDGVKWTRCPIGLPRSLVKGEIEQFHREAERRTAEERSRTAEAVHRSIQRVLRK